MTCPTCRGAKTFADPDAGAIPCRTCSGDGTVHSPCAVCSGRGHTLTYVWAGVGGSSLSLPRWVNCSACGGTGVPLAAARSEHIHARWGKMLARPGMSDEARGPKDDA